MRKRKGLPAVAVAAVCICGSLQAAAPECVRKSVMQLKETYPELRLQDVYKYFFHDAFGPGHLIPSREGARRYLRSELEQMRGEQQPAAATKVYYEPSGCGDNFYHVSLEVIADSLVDFDTFFTAFYDGMEGLQMPTIQQWSAEWAGIERTVAAMNLNLPDYAADKGAIERTLASGRYAMHHSAPFRSAYKPHYRLIRKDIFAERILPLLSRNFARKNS